MEGLAPFCQRLGSMLGDGGKECTGHSNKQCSLKVLPRHVWYHFHRQVLRMAFVLWFFLGFLGFVLW